MKSLVPKHLGIIMDGNRRWAKERGLPAYEGHREGYENLKRVGDWCLETGVEFLTVFGFSTENWKRSGEEVSFLMQLFQRAVTVELDEFHGKGIRLRILGRREGLPPALVEAFAAAEKKTAHNTRATLSLAINYGGRAEIVDAVKTLIAKGAPAREITEEVIAKELTTNDLPDPDLIIRTSGEERLSGFLPWQSVYSEFMFFTTHWPAFSREEFNRMLGVFAERQRRYGA
jgi:undecaprenyl diphosphate synthase